MLFYISVVPCSRGKPTIKKQSFQQEKGGLWSLHRTRGQKKVKKREFFASRSKCKKLRSKAGVKPTITGFSVHCSITIMEIVKRNFIDEWGAAHAGHHDEIVNSEEFKNYDLIAVYPKMFVFVEKEFVNENPELMDELIKNSIHG